MAHKETYNHGEYLRAFADRLTNNGHANLEKREWEDCYKVNHPYLRGLEVVVKEHGIGFGNVVDYEITLTGRLEQIQEFIRAAGSYVDNLAHSKKVCEKT